MELVTGLNNLTIISPSKWLESVIRKSYLRDYSIKVLPNGIELKKFSPIVDDSVTKNLDKNRFH